MLRSALILAFSIIAFGLPAAAQECEMPPPPPASPPNAEAPAPTLDKPTA
jgi:hypothetical protein